MQTINTTLRKLPAGRIFQDANGQTFIKTGQTASGKFGIRRLWTVSNCNAIGVVLWLGGSLPVEVRP